MRRHNKINILFLFHSAFLFFFVEFSLLYPRNMKNHESLGNISDLLGNSEAIRGNGLHMLLMSFLVYNRRNRFNKVLRIKLTGHHTILNPFTPHPLYRSNIYLSFITLRFFQPKEKRKNSCSKRERVY